MPLRGKFRRPKKPLRLFGLLLSAWALSCVAMFYAGPHLYVRNLLKQGFSEISFPGQVWANDSDLLIMNDMGGKLMQRVAHAQWLSDHKKSVHVLGICASACTTYLSVPNVCAAPASLWMFHKGFLVSAKTGERKPGNMVTEHLSWFSTRNLDAPLRRWVRDLDASLTGEQELWVTGQDFIEAGWLRACDADMDERSNSEAALGLSQGVSAPYPLPHRR